MTSSLNILHFSISKQVIDSTQKNRLYKAMMDKRPSVQIDE